MTIAFGWPQPNPTQPLQRAIGTIHLLPGSLVHSTPAAATVRALPPDFPSEDNFVMGDRKKIPRSQALPLQCWLCSWGETWAKLICTRSSPPDGCCCRTVGMGRAKGGLRWGRPPAFLLPLDTCSSCHQLLKRTHTLHQDRWNLTA